MTALSDLADRHAPYLATLFAAATDRARRLHADEVTLEHLIGACVVDEDSAAHEALVHAFADPETIDLEVLALSPGLMVVGSDSALPFTPGSVAALRAARERAAAAGASRVETGHVLGCAVEALPAEARAALTEGGHQEAEVTSEGPGTVRLEGPLFQDFSDDAKRALSLARKAAHQARAEGIAPVRLVLGCLAADGALGPAAGLTTMRATEALRPFADDATPLSEREVSPDAALVEWLRALPDGADSLELLARCHHPATPELAALLSRHQISPALLERSRGVFEDPGDSA